MDASRPCLVAVALILSVLSIVVGCQVEMAASEVAMEAPFVGTATPRPLVESLHLGWVYSPTLSVALYWHVVDEDGTIYIADSTAHIRAIGTQGTERWTYGSHGDFAAPPVLSRDERALYVLTDIPELMALSVDGELLWKVALEGELVQLPAVAPDGTIYVPTSTGGYRISADGQAQPFSWPESARGNIPTFDPQGRMVIASRQAHQVLILRADGTVAQGCQEEEEHISFGPINTAQGFVYALSDGKIVARSWDGAERWRHVLGGDSEKGRIAGPVVDLYPLASGPQGEVYAGQVEGQLVALSPTGELLWQTERDPGVGRIIQLVRRDHVLYAVGSHGWLLTYDLSGKLRWCEQLYHPSLPGRLVPGPDGGFSLVHQGVLNSYSPGHGLGEAQPIPAAAASQDQAEEEIAAFTLDFILQSEVIGTEEYLRETGWTQVPYTASIIIWAPVTSAEPSIDGTDLSNPLRVWWYADGQVTDRQDGAEAIEEYRQEHMPDDAPDIFAWSFSDFGIQSIAPDRRSAEVYVGVHCGPLCGHGMRYSLQRSPSGDWWISSAEWLWQS